MKARILLATLTVLTALGVAGVGIVTMPASAGGPLGAWCRTAGGGLDVSRALAVLSPLVAAAGLALLGRRALRAQPGERVLAHAIGVAVLAGALGAALAFAGAGDGVSLPDATLMDQDGASVALRDLRGRPLLVSAVYSRCSTVCPMALAELTRALEALTPDEHSGVAVVVLTLDPQNDTPARLHELAAGHGLDLPGTRFLTGDPGAVGRVLNELGFLRRRDPVTGLIDHQGLFLLVDEQGRIVARYPSGEAAERGLVAGLRALLAQARAKA